MKSNLFVCSFVGVLAILAACSSNDEKDVAGGVSEDAGFVADVAGVARLSKFRVSI